MIKIRAFLLFILVFLLGQHSVFSKTEVSAIIKLESTVPFMEFDVLDVYIKGAINFPKTDPYPFAGKKIEDSLVIEVMQTNKKFQKFQPGENAQTFAIGRFLLTPRIGAFLVRENNNTITELSISCWLYDAKQKKILQRIPLAGSYGYEGSEGITECWISDITGDGIKDFLQRHHEESTTSQSTLVKDYFTLITLSGDSSIQTQLGFPSMLAQNFKFHIEPATGDIIVNDVKRLLDSAGFTGNKNLVTKKNWFIPLDSSADLVQMNKAQDNLVARMRDKSYFFQQHGWNIVVYRKSNKYFLGYMKQCYPNEAELDLIEIQRVLDLRTKLTEICYQIKFIEGAFCCDCK